MWEYAHLALQATPAQQSWLISNAKQLKTNLLFSSSKGHATEIHLDFVFGDTFI